MPQILEYKKKSTKNSNPTPISGLNYNRVCILCAVLQWTVQMLCDSKVHWMQCKLNWYKHSHTTHSHTIIKYRHQHSIYYFNINSLLCSYSKHKFQPRTIIINNIFILSSSGLFKLVLRLCWHDTTISYHHTIITNDGIDAKQWITTQQQQQQ